MESLNFISLKLTKFKHFIKSTLAPLRGSDPQNFCGWTLADFWAKFDVDSQHRFPDNLNLSFVVGRTDTDTAYDNMGNALQCVSSKNGEKVSKTVPFLSSS